MVSKVKQIELYFYFNYCSDDEKFEPKSNEEKKEVEEESEDNDEDSQKEPKIETPKCDGQSLTDLEELILCRSTNQIKVLVYLTKNVCLLIDFSGNFQRI